MSTPLADTTPAAVPVAPELPRWLRELPYYDPSYPYDPDRYLYDVDFTTDPDYLQEGVRLSPITHPHHAFLAATEGNLQRFLQVTGQEGPVSADLLLRHLPPAVVAAHGRDRVSPDLAL